MRRSRSTAIRETRFNLDAAFISQGEGHGKDPTLFVNAVAKKS